MNGELRQKVARKGGERGQTKSTASPLEIGFEMEVCRLGTRTRKVIKLTKPMIWDKENRVRWEVHSGLRDFKKAILDKK